MAVIVHDACPCCADNGAVIFCDHAVIRKSDTEILVIDLEFRELDDVSRRRYLVLRNEDRLIKEILQELCLVTS